MKKVIFYLAFMVSMISLCYAQDDTPDLDSATAVSFPWYNNNDYLIDYLTERNY